MPKARSTRSPSSDSRLVLAGDIGGTKTLVGLFNVSARGVTLWRHAHYASGAHKSLEAIVRHFMAAHGCPPVAAACFGVAGPVIGGATRLTNLPWKLSERRLAASLDIARVHLLNDVQAAAFGMLHLDKRGFAIVRPGQAKKSARGRWPEANLAVIAPGTGLGEALLYWDGTRHRPVASEGGHGGFAPRGKLEVELLESLRQTHGTHVSCERILSGPGLVAIYEFLRLRARGREAAPLARARASGDFAAAIGAAGIARSDPVATRALEMFVSILGAEAGSLALRFFAVGGVLIGGGIAPKILPALRWPAFATAFTDKGRFASFLRGVPVSVVKDARATLLGAAQWAADRKEKP